VFFFVVLLFFFSIVFFFLFFFFVFFFFLFIIFLFFFFFFFCVSLCVLLNDNFQTNNTTDKSRGRCKMGTRKHTGRNQTPGYQRRPSTPKTRETDGRSRGSGTATAMAFSHLVRRNLYSFFLVLPFDGSRESDSIVTTSNPSHANV